MNNQGYAICKKAFIPNAEGEVARNYLQDLYPQALAAIGARTRGSEATSGLLAAMSKRSAEQIIFTHHQHLIRAALQKGEFDFTRHITDLRRELMRPFDQPNASTIAAAHLGEESPGSTVPNQTTSPILTLSFASRSQTPAQNSEMKRFEQVIAPWLRAQPAYEELSKLTDPDGDSINLLGTFYHAESSAIVQVAIELSQRSGVKESDILTPANLRNILKDRHLVVHSDRQVCDECMAEDFADHQSRGLVALAR